MATKQFYATGDFKYGTRMLRAGDGPVSMDAPTARLYQALRKITSAKPVTSMARPDADGSGDLLPAAAPQPRKRTAKKTK